MVVRMASFESSGRRKMAASTSETISLTRIVRGVGANFGPFSRRERSAVKSGFGDKLIAQFYRLIVTGRSLSASLLRFESLFSCLTSIGHCRNVRGLGKSMVVFRLFEKLIRSNERTTKF